MDTITTKKLDIQKVATSRIHDVDFTNLVFGKTFTDHMFECDFKDGSWQTPTIKPYGPMMMSPAAKVFHYGQAVFEGMKAYKDDNDDVFLFRPNQNIERINKSSKRMAIPEFPVDVFMNALHTLVGMDKDWIQKGEGNSLYLRPFAVATEVGVSASPSNEYKFMILMAPVQAYYKGAVKVLIAEKFSRSASGGVGAVKAAGNYGAQFYPTSLAQEKGFQQIIWTDSNEHKYLEEAGTMNVFFRINDTLITAPVSDRILDGVTRKSILEMAKFNGIQTQVRKLTVDELMEAEKQGSLKEIFGAGTAAVVSLISHFGYKDKVYELPKVEDSYASSFKKQLMDLQYNKSQDPFGWRVEIK
ncbi:MAG TPA: branched chain amino acid aminotransferase [Flavobacteriaceae bacterium]|nr:branched-chain amino acid aminotransferase [Ulvibacter sp.]CAI8303386.1 MAG: Branched-chain-amino-acid aminotransferase 2 [Flavobacteriaceae bacterium]HAH33892.1 branched chain amino acid aminotransferase [Flavobacteriaceae bacterium]